MEAHFWLRRRHYTRRDLIRGLFVAAGIGSLAPLIGACSSKSKTSAAGKSGGPRAAATETRQASAPGVTANVVHLGSVFGLTGPGAGYAPIIQTMDAYFKRVNDEGGVNGRRIEFHIEDDVYTAANALPLTKKLVEQEHVFALVGNLGTRTTAAIVDYTTDQKVPLLFLSSGASNWGNFKQYPYTMGFQPSYAGEARAYGKYIAKTWPDMKAGILYQNDEFGKDYLAYKETTGAGNPTVGEETYEITASDVNQQIASLKNNGVEVLILVAIPKFAGLALKAAADQGWKPNIVMTAVSRDQTIFDLAGGAPNVENVISSIYHHQADSGDASIQPVKDLLARYAPQIPIADNTIYGYMVATLTVQTLKRAGVNPTRESLMAAAESFTDFKIDQLLSGISVKTSKTDHEPIQAVQPIRATGGKFVPFGDIISTA